MSNHVSRTPALLIAAAALLAVATKEPPAKVPTPEEQATLARYRDLTGRLDQLGEGGDPESVAELEQEVRKIEAAAEGGSDAFRLRLLGRRAERLERVDRLADTTALRQEIVRLSAQLYGEGHPWTAAARRELHESQDRVLAFRPDRRLLRPPGGRGFNDPLTDALVEDFDDLSRLEQLVKESVEKSLGQARFPEMLRVARRSNAKLRRALDADTRKAKEITWFLEIYEERLEAQLMMEVETDDPGARDTMGEILRVVVRRYGEGSWHVSEAKAIRDEYLRAAELRGPDRAAFRKALGCTKRVKQLQSQGKPDAAIDDLLATRADLTRMKLAEGPNAYRLANDLASLYKAVGKYQRALEELERAARLGGRLFGPDHPGRALILLDRAVIHYESNQPERALAFAVAADRALGKLPRESASDSLRLTVLRWEARLALETDKPLVARAALFRASQFALSVGEPGAEARSLTAAAAQLQATGSGALARRLLDMAEARTEGLPEEARTEYLDGLAETAMLSYAVNDRATGDRIAAGFQRLWEKHKPIGYGGHTVLAAMFTYRHDWEQVIAQDKKLVEIARDLIGPKRAGAARGRLALHLYLAGDRSRAATEAGEALALITDETETRATLQSEAEQLVATLRARDERNVYLAATRGAPPAQVDEVYARLVRWKGFVFRRRLRLRQLLARHPELRTKREAWQEAVAQLSNLEGRPAPPGSPAASGNFGQSNTLRRRVQELEQVWARGLSDLEPEPGDREVVRRFAGALPADTPVVDFYVYVEPMTATTGDRPLTGKVRLAAFVVRPDRPVQRIDYDEGAEIDLAVWRWRRSIGADPALDGRPDSTPPAPEPETARQLADLLWKPLRPLLGPIRTLVVVPDGSLGNVPFAALPDEPVGPRLIQRFGVCVVPAPQLIPELLAASPAADHPSRILLVGALNYDAGALTDREAAGGWLNFLKGLATPDAPGPKQPFEPLVGSGREVREIAVLFGATHPRGVADVLNEGADERRVVERSRAARGLHLATHGFSSPDWVPSNAGFEVDSSLVRGRFGGSSPRIFERLRNAAGVALSGANSGVRGARGDGIWSVPEIASADLDNLDLVVVSTCDSATGLGVNSEGFLSVQRAFHLAGSRTVVASLWRVPDEATRQLMVAFYKNLWKERLPKLDALRNAQQEVMRPRISARPLGKGLRISTETVDYTAPPWVWAAWSLSGDWSGQFLPGTGAGDAP